MTLIPLTDCCELLALDPKTLRTYLKRATMTFTAHPTDARIKCLTREQVQQLAAVYGCPLPSTFVPSATLSASTPASAASSTSLAEADVLSRLSALETKVAQLADHLTQLAFMLLQEREQAIERRLSLLETVLREAGEKPLSPPPLPDAAAPDARAESASKPSPSRQLNPAEERARSRMPPLIEYSASGTYIMVSSQEGELSLLPDSLDWFEWLATLSSFRFVGQSGRFTAYREADHRGPKRGWTAHRSLHNRRAKHYLGTTDRLTIACLEQGAARIQAQIEAF